jgi:hypothetical protein
VARYLSQLDTADRQEPSEALAVKAARLKEKLSKLKEEMGKLAAYEKEMLASPDQQISLTDPDSRSMATSGRDSDVVGYNVQVAVDTEHHLIVTHEVTKSGSDRAQLAHVAKQAKAVLLTDKLEAVLRTAQDRPISHRVAFPVLNSEKFARKRPPRIVARDRARLRTLKPRFHTTKTHSRLCAGVHHSCCAHSQESAHLRLCADAACAKRTNFDPTDPRIQHRDKSSWSLFRQAAIATPQLSASVNGGSLISRD